MYTYFADLPENSRIWIYQSDRNLTEGEVTKIEDALTSFTGRWQAHGANLAGSFKIKFNRFIILAVDTQTNMPSGCSIDSSVAVLKDIEKTLNVSFFNRTQIPFLEEASEVFTIELSDIKEAIVSGRIDEMSITFNNLVDTKQKLETEWMISAKDSWLKKYFVKNKTNA